MDVAACPRPRGPRGPRGAGLPTLARDRFARHTAQIGIRRWFHFQDPRLDNGVEWMRRRGVAR